MVDQRGLVWLAEEAGAGPGEGQETRRGRRGEGNAPVLDCSAAVVEEGRKHAWSTEVRAWSALKAALNIVKVKTRCVSFKVTAG